MTQPDYIGISKERIMHSLQVGRTTYLLSRDLFNWDEQKCRQMFVLGLVHDCGYEFSLDQTEHPSIGADILSECDYRFSEEIRWHGIASSPYESDELLVLNIADLLTDKTGRTILLSERLGDIKERYGGSSTQYREVCQLVSEITEKLNGMLTGTCPLLKNWNA